MGDRRFERAGTGGKLDAALHPQLYAGVAHRPRSARSIVRRNAGSTAGACSEMRPACSSRNGNASGSIPCSTPPSSAIASASCVERRTALARPQQRLRPLHVQAGDGRRDQLREAAAAAFALTRAAAAQSSTTAAMVAASSTSSAASGYGGFGLRPVVPTTATISAHRANTGGRPRPRKCAAPARNASARNSLRHPPRDSRLSAEERHAPSDASSRTRPSASIGGGRVDHRGGKPSRRARERVDALDPRAAERVGPCAEASRVDAGRTRRRARAEACPPGPPRAAFAPTHR